MKLHKSLNVLDLRFTGKRDRKGIIRTGIIDSKKSRRFLFENELRRKEDKVYAK